MLTLVRWMVCALGFVVAPAVAVAQTYPDRPITIVVPFAAGGGADIPARAIAPALSAALGQPVVIENISGAAGNIAARRVARAVPDGYTLIMQNMAFALNAGLYARLPFDPEKDFVSIAMVNYTDLAFIARKNLPANNLREFVAWAKQNTVTLAHTGVGGTGHIAGELLIRAMGIKADLVPYRGGSLVLQDIIGGQVDIGGITVGAAVEPFKAGQVKVVGTTGKRRAQLLPDVPSLVEEVSPTAEISMWNALMAPGGTPQPVIDKLYEAFETALKDQQVLKSWAVMGMELYPRDQRTPKATAAFISQEIARWRQVMKDYNIQAPQ